MPGPLLPVYWLDPGVIGEEGDCLKVEAPAAGRSLTLAMAAVRNSFASTDFDPVAFGIFFDVPDQDGITVLPAIDAQAPAGCLWDCQQRVCGFGQGLHSQENAAGDCRGETPAGSPQTNVDPAAGTNAFACEADDFGRTEWSGVKICPAARDIDGPDDVHRPPTEAAEPFTFGGRQTPEDDPSLDDTEFWPFRRRPIRAATERPRGGGAGPALKGAGLFLRFPRIRSAGARGPRESRPSAYRDQRPRNALRLFRPDRSGRSRAWPTS